MQVDGFNRMCGISLLELFLAFPVALQLLSQLTDQEATANLAALFMIQAEAINKDGYVAYFLSAMPLFQLTP